MGYMPIVRFEKSLASAVQNLGEDEVLQINSESLISQEVVIVYTEGGKKKVEKYEEKHDELGDMYHSLKRVGISYLTNLLGVFLIKGEPGPLKELRESALKAKGIIPEAIEKALVRELNKIRYENLCLIVKGNEVIERVEDKIEELEKEINIKKGDVTKKKEDHRLLKKK